MLTLSLSLSLPISAMSRTLLCWAGDGLWHGNRKRTGRKEIGEKEKWSGELAWIWEGNLTPKQSWSFYSCINCWGKACPAQLLPGARPLADPSNQPRCGCSPPPWGFQLVLIQPVHAGVAREGPSRRGITASETPSDGERQTLAWDTRRSEARHAKQPFRRRRRAHRGCWSSEWLIKGRRLPPYPWTVFSGHLFGYNPYVILPWPRATSGMAYKYPGRWYKKGIGFFRTI